VKSLAEARIKGTRAVVAARGMSYDEIAAAVGYSRRGSTDRAVFEAIAANEAEDVEMFRAMELDRLDHYLTRIWSKVDDGACWDSSDSDRILEVAPHDAVSSRSPPDEWSRRDARRPRSALAQSQRQRSTRLGPR
jgi:hypothetical protein